jgi:hypothetical protein
VQLYLHSPNTPPWRDAQLKHRDNFTFTFYMCVCIYTHMCKHNFGFIPVSLIYKSIDTDMVSDI